MTKRQLQLLKFIRNTIVHLGKGPTYKEMRDHMDVKSNQAIADVLSVLDREGFIKQEEGRFRGIEVTDKGLVSVSKLASDQEPELPHLSSHSSYGASTSIGFESSGFVFNSLPPSISNLATMEGGERSGGGT
jgi:SOS-response transcriptional repressor LexA